MADDFKYDVFLSHGSRDKDMVRDIANRLKSDGLRVWFDESEIKPGDSIPTKIEDGLEHSRVLVLCMSVSCASGLPLGTYKETDSTVGAWATECKLPLPEIIAGDSSSRLGHHAPATRVEREVWLWDFGWQADHRLIHQFHMDQSHLAALVFDPQKEDHFDTFGT